MASSLGGFHLKHVVPLRVSWVGLLALPAWTPHASRVITVSFVTIAILGTAAVRAHTFWRLMNLGLVEFGCPPRLSYPSRDSNGAFGAGVDSVLASPWRWHVYGIALLYGGRAVPLVAPAFSLACFISNVSFIAPAGFGVREALLIGMIGGTAGFGALFAATTRIVMVLNDMIMIGGAWLLAPELERCYSSGIKSIEPDSLGGKEGRPRI
jgi:hypothetical protein